MKDLIDNYDVRRFDDRLADFEFDLTDHQINQFLRYYELLIEWNQKMNLTGITEFNDVIHKHFVDSIAFSVVDQPEGGKRLLDVGTGAGFPGIPLKIVYPELEITLLDSLNKRLNFLDAVIAELELTNISTVHGRAEDLAHDKAYREQYDYCVSRAVANISTLSEYCLPFLKKGGAFIAYKGGDVEDELHRYIFGVRKLKGSLEKSMTFTIDTGDEVLNRSLLLIRKEKPTPSRYPRKAGVPAKNPL